MIKKLKINGNNLSIKSHTILNMLKEIRVNSKNNNIAVAVNYEVVQKTKWTDYKIKSGDIIEIVRPLKGG
jgi:sulfur carrier protein|tara:strand:- start:152 stop:361 length:210 start_codon:yes stop_codon:yes gene_type:complete